LKRGYLYGYRFGEVDLPKIGEPKEGIRIQVRDRVETGHRRIAAVSLGTHVEGAAEPHPDLGHTMTAVAGVRKRFASKPPVADRKLLRRLAVFVRKWCKHNLTPLGPDVDTSVERWLEHTNYPLWRKKQLLDAWTSVMNIWDKEKHYFDVGSFVKDETYPEYKHARPINARKDEFKCAVGPLFKLIEEQLYKHPSFIKHVPVKDRPDYIMQMLYCPGSKYLATDYTAFESLFVKRLMEVCEYELYKYMVDSVPAGGDFLSLFRSVIMGRNKCKFTDFMVELEATRMSGEMNTSLGNGFSNLMFMLFVCESKGSKNVLGVVEGDDGLFRIDGPIPTPEDFAALGLNIKLDVHSSINTASFCGIVFDPDDRINVTDPVSVMLNFGWTSRRYMKAKKSRLNLLLRCKALCLAHQYPGCPILASLSSYVLRLTPSYDVSGFIANSGGFNSYERAQLLGMKEVPHRDIGINTRHLVEDLFKIPIVAQINIENYFNKQQRLCPIPCELLSGLVSVPSQHYFSSYYFETEVTDACLEFPVTIWPLRLSQGWKPSTQTERTLVSKFF